MAAYKNEKTILLYLKKQWREGMRWCILNKQDKTHPETIRCFKSCREAAIFCKDNNVKTNMPYRIIVISELIEKLSAASVRKKQKNKAGVFITALCEKHPPLSFPIGIDHLSSIPKDVYFPVMGNKVINPISDISEWQVVSEGYPHKIMFKDKEYGKALNFFMNQTGVINLSESRDILKLQAIIRSLSTEISIDIYRFYYHSRRSCYMLDKKIDVSKPFLLPVTYLAKYSSRLQRLEFFDGCLKKITAGKIIEDMDVQYYHADFLT